MFALTKKILGATFLAALILTALMFAFSANFETAQAETTYTISGYIRNPNGTALSGVTTYLINSTGSSFGSTTTSDSFGFYSMTAPVGTYRIVAGGASAGGLTYSEVNIYLNGDITKDITLVPSFAISGYVFDSSGHTVAGAISSVHNSTWSVPVTTTDGLGRYTIYAPAGTYTFVMWPPIANLVSYQDTLVVTSNMTKNVTMASGSSVSGYVRYASGEPVSGVSTYLTNSSGALFTSGRWSDSVGFYLIEVPDGNYTLFARGINGTGISYSEANVVANGTVFKNITLIDAAFTPGSATLDIGQTQQFTASPTGGSGNYTSYTWYVNDVVTSTQTTPTFSFSPTATGTYTITAVVTDNVSATSYRSTVSNITVNSALGAPNASVSHAMIDLGQTATLNSTAVSTGTSPYLYQWYSKAPNASSFQSISGATSPSYMFVTSNSTLLGVWSFALYVTDNASSPVTVASNLVSVTVNAPPAVSVAPAPATLDVGTNAVFTATPSGGSAPLHYQWFLDGLAVGDDSSTYTYSAMLGEHTIYVNLTDSANPPLWALSSVGAVSVNPALVAPVASVSTIAVDQGQSFTLTATASSAGTPPYSYQWFAKAPGGSFSPISGATSDSYTFVTSTSTALGLWSFQVNALDSATVSGTAASNVVSVTVNVLPTVSVSPTSKALNLMQSQLFTATPSGGSGVYLTYQWYVNGQVQAGQTGSTFTYSFLSTGTYLVISTVTDSFSVTSAQSATVTVTVNPALAAPMPMSSSASIMQGDSSTLTVSVSTGTPSYTYLWYSMMPGTSSYSLISGATSSSYSFVTTSTTVTGVWSFKVQVTDATGDVVNSDVASVSVAALVVSPTPTPTLSPSPTTSPSTTASPTETATVSPSSTQQPTPTSTIPEFPTWFLLFFVLGAIAVAMIAVKRKNASLE